VAVAQSVYFACGLKATEFVYLNYMLVTPIIFVWAVLFVENYRNYSCNLTLPHVYIFAHFLYLLHELAAVC
jgi:hypothetical protein